MDTISEKDTQSADDKKKEKISYIEAIPEWQALRREYRSQFIVNAEKFMNVVRRHTSFEELTPTLLREFVEKIVVHECSYDENKTRRQDIEIYYSFVGKVDLPE